MRTFSSGSGECHSNRYALRTLPDFPGSHAPEAVKELVKNVIKSLIHHEDHEGHEEKIKLIKSLKLRALRVLRG